MTKKGSLILIGVVGVIGLVVFIFTGGIGEKRASISLDAYPQSTVFINDQEAGMTPYENDNIGAGETKVKLVPQDSEISSIWERTVFLNPNTQTIISREFNSTPELSGGRMIYLEKTSANDKSGLSVICHPEECSVSIGGQMRGFSPLNLEDIGEGEHRISVAAPGFQEIEIMARALNGYRLSINIDLISQEDGISQIVDAAPTPAEIEEVLVIIGQTPTGWLRVRSGPGTSHQEVGRVLPGEEYDLLEEDGGWYKIEYEEGEEGWVSDDYAQKSE